MNFEGPFRGIGPGICPFRPVPFRGLVRPSIDIAQSIEALESHEYETIDDEFHEHIHEMNVNEAYGIVPHSQESALELETHVQTTSL